MNQELVNQLKRLVNKDRINQLLYDYLCDDLNMYDELQAAGITSLDALRQAVI